MPADTRNWKDRDIAQIVANLLRIGVTISAAVVFTGGLLFLIQHGAASPDFQTFHGEPRQLRRISGIVTAAFSLDSRGIIQLGLLILIATPIARVAVSSFYFALRRDYTYVLLTLIVLAVLLYSLGAVRF